MYTETHDTVIKKMKERKTVPKPKNSGTAKEREKTQKEGMRTIYEKRGAITHRIRIDFWQLFRHFTHFLFVTNKKER